MIETFVKDFDERESLYEDWKHTANCYPHCETHRYDDAAIYRSVLNT